MITYRDLVSGLKQLNLGYIQPAIAHASLAAFGEVRGGAETVLGAVLSTVDALMMPTFTYKTMVIPEEGPPDNGITYGGGRDLNRLAEIFRKSSPADKSMGIIAETLRQHPDSQRSTHPILSFAGVNLSTALAAQTLQTPLTPLRYLVEQDGVVLLLGVNHTANTAIHYAEKLAGRMQFVRWALTREGIVECPGFPGCSNGFEQAVPFLARVTQRAHIGNAVVQKIRLRDLVEIIVERLRKDPLALLCRNLECERCSTVRRLTAIHD